MLGFNPTLINSACGEFHPRYHTVKGYAAQRRLAKKIRNKKNYKQIKGKKR